MWQDVPVIVNDLKFWEFLICCNAVCEEFAYLFPVVYDKPIDVMVSMFNAAVK